MRTLVILALLACGCDTFSSLDSVPRPMTDGGGDREVGLDIGTDQGDGRDQGPADLGTPDLGGPSDVGTPDMPDMPDRRDMPRSQTCPPASGTPPWAAGGVVDSESFEIHPDVGREIALVGNDGLFTAVFEDAGIVGTPRFTQFDDAQVVTTNVYGSQLASLEAIVARIGKGGVLRAAWTGEPTVACEDEGLTLYHAELAGQNFAPKVASVPCDTDLTTLALTGARGEPEHIALLTNGSQVSMYSYDEDPRPTLDAAGVRVLASDTGVAITGEMPSVVTWLPPQETSTPLDVEVTGLLDFESVWDDCHVLVGNSDRADLHIQAIDCREGCAPVGDPATSPVLGEVSSARVVSMPRGMIVFASAGSTMSFQPYNDALGAEGPLLSFDAGGEVLSFDVASFTDSTGIKVAVAFVVEDPISGGASLMARVLRFDR